MGRLQVTQLSTVTARHIAQRSDASPGERAHRTRQQRAPLCGASVAKREDGGPNSRRGGSKSPAGPFQGPHFNHGTQEHMRAHTNTIPVSCSSKSPDKETKLIVVVPEIHNTHYYSSDNKHTS